MTIAKFFYPSKISFNLFPLLESSTNSSKIDNSMMENFKIITFKPNKIFQLKKRYINFSTFTTNEFVFRLLFWGSIYTLHVSSWIMVFLSIIYFPYKIILIFCVYLMDFELSMKSQEFCIAF